MPRKMAQQTFFKKISSWLQTTGGGTRGAYCGIYVLQMGI
jgi:hypothetical protein